LHINVKARFGSLGKDGFNACLIVPLLGSWVSIQSSFTAFLFATD